MWVKKECELYWEEECDLCWDIDSNHEQGFESQCPQCKGEGYLLEKVSIEKPDYRLAPESIIEIFNKNYNTQLSYQKDILQALEAPPPPPNPLESNSFGEDFIAWTKHKQAQDLLKSYTYTNNQITKT